jgi:tagatose 6-phosphate kinase
LIVTVTLNPSLHVRYDADRVELGASNQVSRVRHQVGGRGLAVAKLLRIFGHEVVAAGLAGGSAGEIIRAELARAGVATHFTRINAESRRVLQVTDTSGGAQTAFDEPAPYITTEELGRLAADYRALLDGATAVVLCGSLPAGLPAETYGSLTSYAVDAGVPVVLDAGGPALRYGVARGPALVIPDLAAGEPVPEVAGGGSLVLPADGGVRVLTAAGEWLAGVGACRTGSGPRPAAGFRDALVAGFVPGIALAWSWPDMLRHAVALAASVSSDGEADLAAYEQLLPEVTLAGPAP